MTAIITVNALEHFGGVRNPLGLESVRSRNSDVLRHTKLLDEPNTFAKVEQDWRRFKFNKVPFLSKLPAQLTYRRN